MYMKKGFVSFIFLICFLPIIAQDTIFSQFHANALYYNPAAAGNAGTTRLFAQYRNQWPAMGNAFVTYDVSADLPIDKYHNGFGINAMYDRLANGIITNTLADFIYSFRWKATRSLNMTAGLALSFYFYGLNVDC